jgi:C_GCAxxG_C_C family probable redox protein
MSRAKEAVVCHDKGYNCSQSVFSTYCEQLGLKDKELALKLSCGLGGGMGRLGETCGAVTGAYLLIGLKYGKVHQDDNNAKEVTYATVREFSKRFIERNGSTNCKELLGVDLLTGDKSVASERVRQICPKMIKDAAEIIEEMLDLA